MPMVKRYLPMYQSPELIEELKRHNRMRLVQEREAKRHRSKSPCPSLDSISTDVKKKDRRIDRSPAPGPSVSMSRCTCISKMKNSNKFLKKSGRHIF